MKLANVLARLNAINEKKTLVDDQDKQSKVRGEKEPLSKAMHCSVLGGGIIRHDVALGKYGRESTDHSTTSSRSE